MITITKEDFEAVCPSGTTPDDSLLEQLRVAIADAHADIIRLLSVDFTEALPLEAALSEDATDDDMKMAQAVKKYVICKAYHEAVPQLDLVQTSTGFGVVSNQNVAPASADRVERLRRQLCKLYEGYLMDLLELARHREDIPEHTRGIFSESLFWHLKYFKLFGIAEPTLADRAKYWEAIYAGEYVVKHIISPEQFKALTGAVAYGRETETQIVAMRMCRNVVVAYAGKSDMQIFHRNALIQYLEEHPEDFPEYMGSSAYKAIHFTPYRNEKSDTCFFFG